jgi:hypothetical protein
VKLLCDVATRLALIEGGLRFFQYFRRQHVATPATPTILEEGLRAAGSELLQCSIDTALGDAERFLDLAVPADAGLNQLRRDEPEHARIVRPVVIDRVGPHEVRPPIVIAPYADDVVDGGGSMGYQW